MKNQQENVRAGGFSPVNLLSKAPISNPFPFLAQLRSSGAVVAVPAFLAQLRSSGTFVAPPESSGPDTPTVWAVTRLEEAVQFLKNPLFVVNPSPRSGNKKQPPALRDAQGPLEGPFVQSMLAVDGLDHQRLRRLVSKAFTPRYVQSLRPSIQQIADELLDRVQNQGHMDLVQDYAFPLPIQVISTMLGVPTEGHAIVRNWAELISRGGEAYQDPARVSIVQTFLDYLDHLIAEKRAHPTDDLISELVQVEEQGDRLSKDELFSTLVLLIFAGHETTSNLISLGMLALFDAPTQLQRLHADLSLMPTAVEELLRSSGPVLLLPFPRFATEDVILGGQQIRKGDLVLIVVGSANHDESQFTEPEELDIARTLKHHIAFGQGIHVCLGAPLARLEGDIALTTLLRRLPDVRLALPRDEVMWRGDLNLRGVSSLPVVFSSVRET